MTPEPASEFTQAAPVESDEPPRSSSRGVVTGLLLVLATAGAVASFPLWREQAGFPAAQPGFELENLRAELSAMTARLAQLEAQPASQSGAPVADDARLAALEKAIRAVQTPPSGLSPLAADIETVTKQVAELRKTAVDAATILRLADRIDQADAAIRDLQARRSSAAALLLATSQLREAVNLGQGFDTELRVLRVLAGDDAAAARALDSIKDRAASGIAPRGVLAGRFEALAPAILRAEILPEGEGWWRRVVDRLLSLVTIRREDGTAAGSTTAAIVARTQAALTRGDLAAASAEAEALTGGPAELTTSWRAEGKARLAADKALSELAAQALALAGVKP
ncbi:MAG: mitofilin family membrane protein [Phaeospirillum sp.]|nr:mitofilin family membrane protein [Phaeospirillum sp.]